MPKRRLKGSISASGIGIMPAERTGLSASSGRGGCCHRKMCMAPSVKTMVAP